jgi:2-dehydropantoate 2-reductase
MTKWCIDHIVVLGAGAIGSLYAAHLTAGHEVTVVGRQTHVDAINRDGLRVVGLEDRTCHVRAVTHLDSILPRTLVLLTTKVNDSRSAIVDIADIVRDDTIVLCVQNGLHSETIVKAVVGDRCVVLRAITQFGAIFREPGVVEYKVKGSTVIEASQVSAAIADLLGESGLGGRVSDDIAVDVWKKLIFNCVINPITSIIGSDVGTIADTRLDPLKRLVIDECVHVAGADGVVVDFDAIKAIADSFGTSRNIASMRQDLLKGKPTEIDHMNGAVVARGEQLGIPCPVNRALVAIIKAMEARACFVIG